MQLDRNRVTVAGKKLCLERQVRLFEEPSVDRLIGNVLSEPGVDDFADLGAHQGGEALVYGDNSVAVANDQPFDGSVGKAAHPVGFEFRAAQVPGVEATDPLAPSQ